LDKEQVVFELHCRNVGFDCPGAVRGTTKEEVLKHAAAHAVDVHGAEVTPGLAAMVMAAIQDCESKGRDATAGSVTTRGDGHES